MTDFVKVQIFSTSCKPFSLSLQPNTTNIKGSSGMVLYGDKKWSKITFHLAAKIFFHKTFSNSRQRTF